MIRNSIARAVSSLVTRPVNGAKLSFEIVMKKLFTNGEQGFWYDPNDLSTMFQDAAGTVPVTAVGQAVGLVLDKSRGLRVGNELWVNQTPSIQNTSGTIGAYNSTTRTMTNTGTNVVGYPRFVFNVGAIVGKRYFISGKLSGNVSKIHSFGKIRLSSAGSEASLFYNNQTGEFYGRVLAESDSLEFLTNLSVGESLTLDSISVKELAGNHAYQSVSAARPILQHPPILAPNLLPVYDFRTWNAINSPSLITANSFTTSAIGGVRTDILKPNTSYVIELDIENTSNVGIYHGANANTTVASGTRRKVLVQVTTDTGIAFYLRNSAAGTTTVYSIKVQEITGYRTDQNYLAFDAVDDKLITNLPAQLTGCTVIRSVPNVGTQILTNQKIPATYEDNKDHCGLIVINRALTPSETSAIATEFNKRAGV